MTASGARPDHMDVSPVKPLEDIQPNNMVKSKGRGYHKKFDSDDSGSFERVGDLSGSDDENEAFNMIDIDSIGDMEGVDFKVEDPLQHTAADEQLFKDL